jgi:predicted RNase H-like HicB family nuclease
MSTINVLPGKVYDGPPADWTLAVEPGSYHCHVALLNEEDGNWSAIVLNLPGAGSCGATEKEALANVREAIIGVVGSFVEDDEDIPWADPAHYSIPDEAVAQWIIVNV